MAKVSKILRSLWVFTFFSIFAAGMVVLFPIFWWGMRKESRFPWVHRVRSRACSLIMALTGLRLSIQHEFDGPLPQQCIFVGNHASLLDVLAGAVLTRRELLFLGKAELAKVPLLGYFFRHMDIPVDRHSREGAGLAYERANHQLDRGANLIIFPEATTSSKAPQLLNFKNGAFNMAVSRGIPVIPVTFVDNWRLWHYDEKWNGRPGKVRVIVHAPLYPADDSVDEINRLRHEAHDIITRTMKRYFPDPAYWS